MAQRLGGLSIRGFRALDRLEIPLFSDVNLIVGKNSTGKTTMLEALQLLLSGDIRIRLYSMLVDRGEWSIKRWQDVSRSNLSDSTGEMSYEALFSGRPDLFSQPNFIISGGNAGPELLIDLVWLRREHGEDASVRYVIVDDPELDVEAIPGLRVESSSTSRQGIQLIPLDRLARMITRRVLKNTDTEVVFLSSSGMSMEEIGQTWDSVALTDDEDDVVEALKIIAPSLEKLVMVQSPTVRSERMLMAKISEFRSPIPFKSLGEGAMHLLSIVLGTIQARGSTLLVDEIASGIHYSVQPQLWNIIFRQAARYNIQVFATTHSWDCVKALHRASDQFSYPSAALHRLERRQNGVHAVSFSSDELAIADAEDIEIR